MLPHQMLPHVERPESDGSKDEDHSWSIRDKIYKGQNQIMVI